MNSLINRLNPKTTNFESTGTGSSVGAITAADVCIALSYSKMSPISCELIRFKCLNDATPERIRLLATQLTSQYADRFNKTGMQDNLLIGCIIAALIEFCMVPATYKPSGRNRALFIGISEKSYRHHNLKPWVDQIGVDILATYTEGQINFSKQLKSLRSISN